MTGIKICGLRRKEDIEYVNRYLPEFIGFIFAKSKRQITMETARLLRDALSPRIKAVGVFVNEDVMKISEIARYSRLDCIQLHGDESPEYIDKIKSILPEEDKKRIEIWKAIRVKDEKSLKTMGTFNVNAFLLDAYVEGSYGGAGNMFDWQLASVAAKSERIILAGGLSPQNVKTAVARVKPFAVDVSSGVETEGFKDENKVRDFIDMVRGIDKELYFNQS